VLLRVRVFADLWKRGHFVAFGSKFGVDFLVYEGTADGTM
jgi:tRNA splicing endonuclease